MDANLETYVGLLRSLHNLIAEGEGDSPEADAIRDDMDGPWKLLSSSQRVFVDAISEDLYRLAEHPRGFQGRAGR